MSSVKISARNRMILADRPPRRLMMPYVLSLAIHGTLILVIAVTMSTFRGGPAGFSNQSSDQIGLIVDRPGDGHGPGTGIDSKLPGDPQEGAATEIAIEPVGRPDQGTPTNATSDRPPAALSLPTADVPTQPGVGVGVGLSLPAGGGAGGGVENPYESVKSQGGVRPAKGMYGSGGPGGGGVPGTSFMGTRDEGMKVVFVIDASGSMTSHNAMQVAKGALMSSLQALDERQQFMIIFYDDKPHLIKLHDETKPTMAKATDLNKTLARQKISGIQPGSGTDHLPPLEMALRMNPEVIFFLTDALEPPLWPKDLERIRTMNGGRVRIHSIEFGQGPELGVDANIGNFLRKLANQNGGSYRYHDVTRFKG
ncbi:MAG TPA: VWA domain-containing protein [Schlesneria sp.]